jgi:hypothetical protein
LPRRKQALLSLASIVLCGSVCFGKTTKISGKIVAYDLMRHSSKAASGVQNEEAIILETPGQKRKFVKVVSSSFGTTQIEQKYFDGTAPVTLEVFRDHSCDESSPTLVSQATLQELGGTYLLTEAFKSSPPSRIKTLECYVAIYRTKK